MSEHAAPQYREAPEGLETKSTAGATIGHNPAAVPHLDRTGAALTADERRKADQHGDLAHGFSGVPVADADQGGLTTSSGGTQTTPVPSSKAAPKTAPKA